jgi:hypothetical protein
MITVLALTAATAWAQGAPVSSHLTGTVAQIDAATRTIYLTDGRRLRLEPGVVLTVDGREIQFEALRPGSSVTVASRAPATQPLATLTNHPPVDVSGTVAHFDRQSGVITLQDGRMVKLTGQTMIWQPVPATATIQPGAEVYVRNAQPVVAAVPGQAGGGDMRMGTVLSVDPGNALVMLHDGTFVSIMPTTRMHMAGRNLTIAELRPGDEVVIRPHGAIASQPSTIVGSSGAVDAPSALPQQAFGSVRINAADIQVIRRPQAP